MIRESGLLFSGHPV